MDTRKYYILIAILAVAAGAAAFYFFKPAGAPLPESVKLDEGAIKGLVNQDQTPPLPKPQPKPRGYTPDEMFAAYSAANENLAKRLKDIDLALRSEEHTSELQSQSNL